MTESVINSFVREFQTNVHVAYQRKGSKLRPTLRQKSDVKGSSTTFQKVGKGTAATKARHGKVPVMNVDHTPIECTLADYYAGDWVDRLDELKVNIDEQKVQADAGAYALGRKTDQLVIDVLDGSTNYALDGTTALTKTGAVRNCYWYHKTAVGHASGSDVKTDITWHGDRAAHFVNNMMSQGAVLIDTAGVVSLRCLEA